MRKLPLGLIGFAAALFFSAAASADQITAIQVAPGSPQAGQNAAVTLQGTGTCSGLVLDWGDGSPTYQHGNQITLPFPKPQDPPISHPYANAGSYTLKIAGVSGCVGKGMTKNITVAAKPAGGGIVDLCKHVDCGGILGGSQGSFNPGIINFPLIEPKIDYFGFSNFTPGGEITVVGSGFGNIPGTLVMLGYGAPIPFKMPEKNVPGILSWKDTVIVATIPNNITGVVDQPVAFYVLTSGKLKSKYSIAVPFVATREARKIPYGDPAVTVVACGTDSNLDGCNGWVDTDDSGPYPDLSSWGATLAGNHLNCWGCIGDDTGSDVYQVKVGNGWVLDQVFFSAIPSDPGEASAYLVTSLPPGASTWQPSISWVVTSNDFIHYTMDIYVAGPKGVPYH